MASEHPWEEQTETTSAKSRVQAIKRKNLEKQLEALEADYTAAFEQMDASSDEVTRTRLERRAQSIESELDKVAEKLEKLL